MWAIVKIQANVRRMIAQRKYKKLKVIISAVCTVVYVVFHFKFVCKFDFNFLFPPQYDYRHHIEALRLKKKEERELKEAGNKRAKEIAEQNYRVRLCFNILFSAVTDYLVG